MKISDDTRKGVTLLLGEHGYVSMSVDEALSRVQESLDAVRLDWIAGFSWAAPPLESVHIGHVKVRSGDRAFQLYVIPRPAPGTPPRPPNGERL